MAYLERNESQTRRVVQSSMTSTTTRTSSVRRASSERSEVKMEIKGPAFEQQEITMFTRHGFTPSTESRQWQSSGNTRINYSSFDQQSLVFDTSSGGRALAEGRSVAEHRTKSPDRSNEPHSPPVEVVLKEKSQFKIPEWMEEKKSPEEKRKSSYTSQINLLLKYPTNYSPKRNSPDPKKVQHERPIHPEVTTREKAAIPILSLDDFNKEDEDDDDGDDDDEFEEVIVVMDVQRRPIWRKGLEKPKPQAVKAGVPVEDLLQVPTPKVKRETVPDKLSIDERIEYVERPPLVHEALDLAGILDNL